MLFSMEKKERAVRNWMNKNISSTLLDKIFFFLPFKNTIYITIPSKEAFNFAAYTWVSDILNSFQRNLTASCSVEQLSLSSRFVEDFSLLRTDDSSWDGSKYCDCFTISWFIFTFFLDSKASLWALVACWGSLVLRLWIFLLLDDMSKNMAVFSRSMRLMATANKTISR